MNADEKRSIKQEIISCNRCEHFVQFSARERVAKLDITLNDDIPVNKHDWEKNLCRDCLTLFSPPVPMYGPGNSHVVLVGEAPGEEEVVLGKPFVGAAGQKLQTAVEKQLGWALPCIYITNVVKCRPVQITGDDKLYIKNRKPTDEEIETCDFFVQEMGLLRPNLVVAIGKTALYGIVKAQEVSLAMRTNALLYTLLQGGIISKSGVIIEDALQWDDGHTAALAIILHPAAAMRKRKWQETWLASWEKIKDWSKSQEICVSRDCEACAQYLDKLNSDNSKVR